MSIGIIQCFNGGTPDFKSFLENSVFDELMEIDLNKDEFHIIFHVEDKYAIPVTEGGYSAFIQYASEYLIFPEDRKIFLDSFPRRSQQNKTSVSSPSIPFESAFRIRGEEVEWIWVSLILVSGPDFGLADGIFRCYLYDIQNVKNRESGNARVHRKTDAVRDKLTGLLRGRDFMNRATDLLPQVSSSQWAILMIDLENFKLFNDWYGWEKGDMVLSKIGSELLSEAKTTGGLAGYLGNDDFCLMAPAEKLNLEELYARIHGVLVRYGVSFGFLPCFGVTFSNPDTFSVMTLMDQASVASNIAKKDINQRICYYDSSLAMKTEEEYKLLTSFQEALNNGEITFYLQPQCNASTGRIIGAESLARWIKKDGTFISPAVFVPVLEKYGFVTDLDKYIWESVCKRIREERDQNHTLLPISVNVSQVDIYTMNVPDYLEQLMLKYDLPKDALKIEITESACAESSDIVRNAVRELRSKGFTVLMDDFGSGYSSLNMLHELEVDIVKLDARFLHLERSNETKGIHIIESIINMTKTMGLPIIVEGVETKEQKDFLMNMGVHYVQGYYFYRPMPEDEFSELVNSKDILDINGMEFKANDEFHVREFLDESVYSDSMLNMILGPVAFYALHDNGQIDIVRFNEQFAKTVNLSLAPDRLINICRYIPEAGEAQFKATLSKAERDRLNGASALIPFSKSDGTFARCLIHFYYLGRDSSSKRFYGSVRDVTAITNMQEHMSLLAEYSSDCIIFVSRKNNEFCYEVAAQGLKKDTGLSMEQLAQELNDKTFLNRVLPEYRERLENYLQLITKKVDFVYSFSIENTNGDIVKLYMRSSCVSKATSNVKSILVVSRPQKI